MRIRWERIIGISLLAASVYLAVKLQPLLKNIFKIVNEDCGYDRPIKAIMLGVLCLSGLAAIKILIRK